MAQRQSKSKAKKPRAKRSTHSTRSGRKRVKRPRRPDPDAAPAWVEPFLEELIERQDVAKACRAVGIDRTTPYKHREIDEDFAKAWDVIVTRVRQDQVRASIHEIATQGFPKIVEVEEIDDEGKAHLVERKVSREPQPATTIFWAKAQLEECRGIDGRGAANAPGGGGSPEEIAERIRAAVAGGEAATIPKKP